MTVDDLQQRHDDALAAVLDTAKAVAETVRRLAVDGDGTDDTPAQQLGRLETAARAMHETAEAVEAMLGPAGADSRALADLQQQLIETAQRGASTAETLEQVHEHLVERIDALERKAPPAKG